MTNVASEVNDSSLEDGPIDFTKQVVSAMAAELEARLAGASVIKHAGEKGRARENLLVDFLQKILPRGFKAGTGFVIDASGGVSRQQDIVIYRESYHPVFEVGGVMYYILESVVAVIEVKSFIDSRVLLDALDCVASVKALDRTGRGLNYPIIGNSRAAKSINPEEHLHQVFSAVIAVESIGVPAVAGTLRAWLSDRPRREWPNQLVSLSSFAMVYSPSTPRCDPMAAQEVCFALDTSSEPKNTKPILDFTQQLMSFLRVVPLIDYRPSCYIPGSYHGTQKFSVVD